MLDKVIRFAFGFTGAITGVTLARLILLQYGMREVLDTLPGTAGLMISALVLGILMYLISGKLIKLITQSLDKMETAIGHVTLYELIIGVGGLIAGLVIANLLSIPLVRIPVIGVTLSMILNVLFGFSGIYFSLMKRSESLHGISNKQKEPCVPLKVLDTSAIIDGRILDMCRTGFLEGELAVPGFILEELRHLADSHDDMIRTKGRRGLDVLNAMKKEIKNPVRIEKVVIEGNVEVDEQLLAYAKESNAVVITTDYNLGKVAAIRNIQVLNINDLANALKPVAVSGEEILLRILKEGKEAGQGVGYLEDGTMVVVEGGGKYKGQDIDVVVTSVLQTSAGRMIFASYKGLPLSLAK
jgi:uncharacterized protein YacL